MFFQKIKNCIRTVVALLLSLGVAICVWGIGATRFPALSGARSFYLDSPSSQAKIKSTLSLADFTRVRGESVVTSLTEEEGLAFIEAYSARVLFIEEVGGVRSYYCYTPLAQGGIRIGEYFVNLHLAAGEGYCVVGSPIIFGGF